jgi:nitrite reductase/ring-hydroxylating ferredoxin subunit
MAMADVFVARDSELAEGERRVISADGVEIGVFRIGGALYGWRNECPHAGGPVCQGRMIKGVEERLDDNRRSLGIHFVDGSMHVVCPWHGFEFDVRTGRHAGTAKVRLKRHAVEVRAGDIYVMV